MNIGRDAFTLRVCEELFGCHLEPAPDGAHRCSCCESVVNIKNWVHAKHDEGCIIIDVRDYLALYMPELTRSHGKDWVSRFKAQSDIHHGDNKP
jgi:hypothetical protein